MGELNHTLARTSICGLGQVALGPLMSVIENFPAAAKRLENTAAKRLENTAAKRLDNTAVSRLDPGGDLEKDGGTDKKGSGP